jgi:3-hydroxybutyryl-CoA dehydrogenase
VARIACSSALDELAESQLAIEALVEYEGAKVKIFEAFDGNVDPETILASSTSPISIAGLAAATSRPDRVMGLHWSLPLGHGGQIKASAKPAERHRLHLADVSLRVR